MKKKVCVVTRRMVAGGIEKALLNMINSMDRSIYDIDLFVMGTGGEFFDEIPSWVHIKPLFGFESSNIEKILKYMKSFKYKKIANLVLSKTSKNIFNQEKYMLKNLEFPQSYDIAIAYHVPASLPVICVSEKIKAKKKLAWIHSDVSMYKEEMKKYIDYYNTFDSIICVSKDAKKKFEDEYPHLKNKTKLFYNIIDRKEILLKSKVDVGIKKEKNTLILTTVARLTEEKGIDMLLRIAKRLKKNNIKFYWYIVGDGELKNSISKEINNLNLKNQVIMTGMKKNPYPYMKACDIYVQPSRHEGFCITLGEAKILNKIIIATDFAGARDQLVNGKDGIITSFSCDEIYNAIEKINNDNTLKNNILNGLYNKNDNLSIDIESII